LVRHHEIRANPQLAENGERLGTSGDDGDAAQRGAKPLDGRKRRARLHKSGGELIAKKYQARAGHADQQIELAGFHPFQESKRLALVVESTLLHGRRYEWIATLPADEGVHFSSATAFQTENAKTGKWHE